MSVVPKVSFHDACSGRRRLAVLKMYNRRFSPSLRRTYSPEYNDDTESAWREYVRDGKAPALFAFLDEERRLENEEEVLVDTGSENDDSSSSGSGDDLTHKMTQTAAEIREKKGKCKGIIQWKAQDLVGCETRAYAKLSHLQGRYIPRLLVQVHITIEAPPDLRGCSASRNS